MSAAAQLLTKGEAIGLAAAFVLITTSVWFYQNKGERLGGKISPIKSAWLAYAIVLWFGVPIVLWDAGAAFIWLAVSMLIRAAVEIPLCITGRWRVAYGIGHDLIHGAVRTTGRPVDANRRARNLGSTHRSRPCY